jgi:hypothetical protein
LTGKCVAGLEHLFLKFPIKLLKFLKTMRCEDDAFEVMSPCMWIMSNFTWEIINRKTLRRLCKYIFVIFEYFLTTTNALFHGNFQKFLNSTWRLKISQRPLTKVKNGVCICLLESLEDLNMFLWKQQYFKPGLPAEPSWLCRLICFSIARCTIYF